MALSECRDNGSSYLKMNNVILKSLLSLIVFFYMACAEKVPEAVKAQDKKQIIQKPAPLIQVTRYGWIDWTEGAVYGMASADIGALQKRHDLKNRNEARYVANTKLANTARSNLSMLVAEIVVDADHRVGFFVKQKSAFSRWLQNYITASKLHNIEYSRDGTTIKVVHKLDLFGENDLRQSLLRINADYFLGSFKKIPEFELNERIWEEGHTALVVDAREQKDFAPSLMTRILRESREVFYPLQGTSVETLMEARILFLSDPHDAVGHPALGKNPYYAMACGLHGQNKSDILLSDLDCRYFLNRQQSLESLRAGRIFVVTQ